MPRLTPAELQQARIAKRESIARRLVQAVLGTDEDVKAVLAEIDEVFFVAVEAALWHWFYNILPKHFGRSATELYGYPNRKKGYMVGKFVGASYGSGGRSKWRLPLAVAYRMGGGKGPGTAPDPYPLELSGSLKTRILAAPAGDGRIHVRRIRNGYSGTVTLQLPAYIRRADIEALKRYIPQDIEEMISVASEVVHGALAA